MFIRLDDGFADHPKILALSDAAFRLHVAAICRCNQNDTVSVENAEARLLAGYLSDREAAQDAISELVRAGLWGKTDEGWDLVEIATGKNALLDHLADAVEEIPGANDEMGTRVLVDDVLTTIKDMRQ